MDKNSPETLRFIPYLSLLHTGEWPWRKRTGFWKNDISANAILHTSTMLRAPANQKLLWRQSDPGHQSNTSIIMLFYCPCHCPSPTAYNYNLCPLPLPQMLLLIELIYQHPISRNVQCSVQLPLVSLDMFPGPTDLHVARLWCVLPSAFSKSKIW